jgi:spore coat protein U-like protein
VFGNYNVFTTSALDSTGTVRYDCNPAAVNISIALSRGASSNFAPRRLTNGTESLNYNLYLDASRTQVWGDGTLGTAVLSVANPANTNPGNTSRAVDATVYGRIPALQDVSAGAYTDTVVVTVNF